jgi:hypothetical protein
MKCSKCGERFRADSGQPAPGGSSSPGEFFLLMIAGVVAFPILDAVDFQLLAFISLIAAAFSFFAIWPAWFDCKSTGVDGKPGGICPSCGQQNRVWPWSI